MFFRVQSHRWNAEFGLSCDAAMSPITQKCHFAGSKLCAVRNRAEFYQDFSRDDRSVIKTLHILTEFLEITLASNVNNFKIKIIFFLKSLAVSLIKLVTHKSWFSSIEKKQSHNRIFHLLKPNSWTYNFVEVSGHNFESSQTWGFRIQRLHYKPVSEHFCSGEIKIL